MNTLLLKQSAEPDTKRMLLMKHCRSVLHHLLLTPKFLGVSDKSIKPDGCLFMHLSVHHPVGCDTLVYVHIA